MEIVEQKKIKIARTRSGVPCLWESNMKFADLRRATVIFSKEGEGKQAVFVNAEKEKQALVPIKEGDFISKAFEDKHGVALSVFKILDVSSQDNTATILPVYRKSSLISEYTVPGEYDAMVNLSIDKLSNPSQFIAYMNSYDKVGAAI
jgi:hypothetical protein